MFNINGNNRNNIDSQLFGCVNIQRNLEVGVEGKFSQLTNNNAKIISTCTYPIATTKKKSVWIIEWSWKISARCIAIKVTISTVLGLLPAMWIMRWRQVMRATTHRLAPPQEWSWISKSYITIWCIKKSQQNQLHVSVLYSKVSSDHFRSIGLDFRVKDVVKPSAMSRVQTLPNSHTWCICSESSQAARSMTSTTWNSLSQHTT